MNSYLLYGRSGQVYVVSANYSHDAIAKTEKQTGDIISCWFMNSGQAKNAVTLK